MVRCWDVGHSVFREAAVFGADVDFLAYSDILWSSRTIIGCHGDGCALLGLETVVQCK